MKRVFTLGALVAVVGVLVFALLFRTQHAKLAGGKPSGESQAEDRARIERAVYKAKQFHRFANGGDSKHPCLALGSSRMEWGFKNQAQKEGWLYFFNPESEGEMWEFAPCSHTNLEDVVVGDLKAEYIRYGDQRLETIFGTDLRLKSLGAMTGRAIIVREGQVLLARLLQPPNLVYAIKFVEQSAPQTGSPKDAELASIRVEYLEIDPSRAEL